MGKMLGADPDQLERLGAAMSELAEQVDGIRGEVNSLLARTTWVGRDGDAFRDDWRGRWGHLLVAVADAGRDGACVLRENAAQQRRASAADGGAVGQGSPVDWGAPPTAAGPSSSGWKDPLDNVMWGLGASSEAIAAITHFKWVKFDDPALASKIKIFGEGLGVLSTAYDAVGFVHGMATDPDSNDTANDGISAGLGVAALVAGSICPPVGIAIGVAGLVFGVATEMDPTLGRDIVDGFVNGATTVWEGASAVAEGAVDLAEDVGAGVEAATEATAGAISGGVEFLKGWLGR